MSVRRIVKQISHSYLFFLRACRLIYTSETPYFVIHVSFTFLSRFENRHTWCFLSLILSGKELES